MLLLARPHTFTGPNLLVEVRNLDLNPDLGRRQCGAAQISACGAHTKLESGPAKGAESEAKRSPRTAR